MGMLESAAIQRSETIAESDVPRRGVEVHSSIVDCAIDPGPLTSEKIM